MKLESELESLDCLGVWHVHGGVRQQLLLKDAGTRGDCQGRGEGARVYMSN
jgi:hypothetical protein